MSRGAHNVFFHDGHVVCFVIHSFQSNHPPLNIPPGVRFGPNGSLPIGGRVSSQEAMLAASAERDPETGKLTDKAATHAALVAALFAKLARSASVSTRYRGVCR